MYVAGSADSVLIRETQCVGKYGVFSHANASRSLYLTNDVYIDVFACMEQLGQSPSTIAE